MDPCCLEGMWRAPASGSNGLILSFRQAGSVNARRGAVSVLDPRPAATSNYEECIGRLAAVALAMADNEKRARGQVDGDAPQSARSQRRIRYEFGDNSSAAAGLNRIEDSFVRREFQHHF